MSQEQQSVSNVEEEISEIFEEEEQEEEEKWETLKNHDDYEISTKYPFNIRKKSNKKIVSEFIRSKKTGYLACALNGKTYDKHRLIGEQFIPNPDNLPQIDHINRDRTDNHINNLRWVSRSDNDKNRTKSTANINIIYEYFDTIDDEAIEVKDYGQHHFEFYYFVEKEDSFYFFNGKTYRKLHMNCDKRNGFYFVNMLDTTNKLRSIRLNKFKRLYDISF